MEGSLGVAIIPLADIQRRYSVGKRESHRRRTVGFYDGIMPMCLFGFGNIFLDIKRVVARKTVYLVIYF